MTKLPGECTKAGCDAPRLPLRTLCHKHYAEVRSAQMKQRRLAIHEAVREYLKSHPCADCGETDPVVLQFDHRDPKEKDHPVSDMISKGRSQKAIFEEIAKCDVRCANCHARKTAKQFGYYT